MSPLFFMDLLGLIPEIFLLLGTSYLLGYAVWIHKSYLKPQSAWYGQEYRFLSSFITHNIWMGMLICLGTLSLVYDHAFDSMYVCYDTLVLDPLSLFLKCLILASTLGIFMLSFAYSEESRLNNFEFVLLILLSALSMMFLVSSYDFISLYLAIEFQSLSFYVLAAMKKDSGFSIEAGLKYFILGAFSSGLYLFGASLIYGTFGTTQFEHIGLLSTGMAQQDPSLVFDGPVFIGLSFLTVAFLFKITAAPFHMWGPDVYEGAPMIVTAFFSTAPKVALVGVIFRMFHVGFFHYVYIWAPIFLLSSLVSMFYGSFGAMGQTRLKRLLAYSSIGHIGYILIGFIAGTLEGLQSVLIYLTVYVVMTLCMFASILASQSPIHKEPFNKVIELKDLEHLGQRHPILALTLSITLLSMAGIPPLAGFVSKYYLFLSALDSSLYSLAIVGILTSVVSCYYYIRVIKTMYFQAVKDSSYVGYDDVLSVIQNRGGSSESESDEAFDVQNKDDLHALLVVAHQEGRLDSNTAHEDFKRAFVIGLTCLFILFLFFYPAHLFILAHKGALALSL